MLLCDQEGCQGREARFGSRASASAEQPFNGKAATKHVLRRGATRWWRRDGTACPSSDGDGAGHGSGLRAGTFCAATASTTYDGPDGKRGATSTAPDEQATYAATSDDGPTDDAASAIYGGGGNATATSLWCTTGCPTNDAPTSAGDAGRSDAASTSTDDGGASAAAAQRGPSPRATGCAATATMINFVDSEKCIQHLNKACGMSIVVVSRCLFMGLNIFYSTRIPQSGIVGS